MLDARSGLSHHAIRQQLDRILAHREQAQATTSSSAADGYPLAATLFLPRGRKRHAVLINSATAVPP